ncbi:MAG: 3D domain-containing protein, partial [Schwartzia sp.]|nr:3D domain-containing protein [Schwartzia sp. (in: firmicutes)]
GKPKKVGVTAFGAVAAKGTIAADPAVYPFGTKIEIPGYGAGIVQDIGGSIKGAHIDIWFPSHEEALAWGVRKLKVKVEKDSKGSDTR